MTTTRSKLMLLTGRRYLPVNLPGFPPLRVRSMNEGERSIVEAHAKTRFVKRLIVVISLCEADSDTPVFSTTDENSIMATVQELEAMDGAVIDQIVTAALPLNRISESDMKALLGEPVAS